MVELGLFGCGLNDYDEESEQQDLVLPRERQKIDVLMLLHFFTRDKDGSLSQLAEHCLGQKIFRTTLSNIHALEVFVHLLGFGWQADFQSLLDMHALDLMCVDWPDLQATLIAAFCPPKFARPTESNPLLRAMRVSVQVLQIHGDVFYGSPLQGGVQNEG